ncbi:inactive serine protease 54 isoform X4 [Anolis carolinensis]|uniref:inactive serine protease 54 isoform X4 n=1 Tax=Anolis carolinensis TaxID=28377 RepID=UPI002F2B7EE8
MVLSTSLHSLHFGSSADFSALIAFVLMAYHHHHMWKDDCLVSVLLHTRCALGMAFDFIGGCTMPIKLLYVCSLLRSFAGSVCGMEILSSPVDSDQGPAATGEFPWLVSLQDMHGTHLAFGSILSQDWLLSTASAFHNITQVMALLGAADPSKLQSFPLPISTIIPHEAFDELTLDHDLALLQTPVPIEFNEAVQPICVPFQRFPSSAMEDCWVVGWPHPEADREQLSVEALGGGRGPLPSPPDGQHRMLQPPGRRQRAGMPGLPWQPCGLPSQGERAVDAEGDTDRGRRAVLRALPLHQGGLLQRLDHGHHDRVGAPGSRHPFPETL